MLTFGGPPFPSFPSRRRDGHEEVVTLHSQVPHEKLMRRLVWRGSLVRSETQSLQVPRSPNVTLLAIGCMLHSTNFHGRELWRPKIAIGEFEDARPETIHGVLHGGVLWRVGAYCPRATFPNGRVVVADAALADVLRSRDVPLTQLPFLGATLSELDWREWDGRWEQELERARRALNVDEYDNFFVPYADLPSVPSSGEFAAAHLARVRRVTRITRRPEMWLVGARGQLMQARAGGEGLSAVTKVDWGLSTYQIPWLFPDVICVENDVKEMLDRAAYPGSVHWVRMRVIGGE
jgi:hypothetical protein